MTTLDTSPKFALSAMLVVCLAVGMAGLTMLTVFSQATEVVVTTNTHAIERHGRDALRARLAVFNCDPRSLQIWGHDEMQANPASVGKWLIVCPNSTLTQCAGMIVGTTPGQDGAYPEYTAFVSSCEYWTVTVPVRDGYISAPAMIVRKALTALLVMETNDGRDDWSTDWLR